MKKAESDATTDRAYASMRYLAPSAVQWQQFFWQLCIALGVLFLASAAVSAVAANWSSFDRLTRIYGVQAVLVAAVLPALWPSVSVRIRDASLFLACVIVGALLALMGQQYQTGADTWQLFALWAVLMLPWAFAANSSAIWALVLVIGNVGLLLAAPGWWGSALWQSIGVFAVANLAILGVGEACLQRLPVPGAYVLRRLLIAWISGLLTAVAVIAFVAEPLATYDQGVSLLVWLIVLGLLAVVYRHVRPDLAVLAMCALSSVVLVTAIFAAVYLHLLGHRWLLLLGILSVLVPALSAAAVRYLRQLGTTLYKQAT